MLGEIRKIHFIGIGGIGMSGMAELLFNLGHTISGSDLTKTDRTDYLNKLGIEISIGHSEENILNPDLVVYSSAVNLDNCEIKAALKMNIPSIKRAEMLGELLKVKPNSVAISGTHGKTTTTSMLGAILEGASLEPTIIVGGIVQDFQSNSLLGNGDIIIIEADEYDKTILSLNPKMSIVTNIDLEHVDCYPNIKSLKDTFIKFMNSIPFYGFNVICIDDDNIKSILNKIKRPYIKYGKSIESDIRYTNVEFNNTNTSYDLIINDNKAKKITLQVPGEHNILNSLAAICIALELNIPLKVIKDSLYKYKGVKRRFEIKHITSNNIIIVDDYAHHPSEIQATISSAKSNFKINNLVVVFQPHLYTRTKAFYREFSKVLAEADIVFLTEIYGSREKKISGVESKMILDQLKGVKSYLLDKSEISKKIAEIVNYNDMVIVMGAGDITTITSQIYNDIEYKINDKQNRILN